MGYKASRRRTEGIDLVGNGVCRNGVAIEQYSVCGTLPIETVQAVVSAWGDGNAIRDGNYDLSAAWDAEKRHRRKPRQKGARKLHTTEGEPRLIKGELSFGKTSSRFFTVLPRSRALPAFERGESERVSDDTP